MTRQVGTIKWFGGFDKTKWRENDYGFISYAGKKDLFVHRENVLCSTDDLTEGVLVTFEIGSKSGKMRAIKVNLLQNESNLNFLASCFEDDAYSSIVAKQYLNQLDNDQAIAAIAVRLQNLSQQEISEWLDNIIVPWLDLPQSELLDPLIPLRKRLELYKNRFVQANPAEQLRLAKKIIAITEHLTSAGKNSNILIHQLIPRSILYLPEAVVLRNHLSLQEQFELCLEIAQHAQTPHTEGTLKEITIAFQKQFAIPAEYHEAIATRMTEFYQAELAKKIKASPRDWKEKTLPAIIRRLPADLLLAAGGRKLRRSLPIPDIWGLCITAKRRNDQTSLKRIVSELTEAREKEFWAIALRKLTDKNQLLTMAPANVRAQWLDKHYSQLNRIIEGYMNGGQKGPVYQWSPNELLKRLTDNDRQLARLWVPPAKDEGIYNAYQAQMLSARTAEIVARLFYQALGFTCTDIAITQLNNTGEDWKTHDLLLNGRMPIDVKNARTPYNDNTGYVEHCIPRFKQTRDLQSVTITGVLSPYLTFHEFVNSDSSPYPSSKKRKKGRNQSKRNVTFLGEITQDKVERLQIYFASNRFNPYLMERGTFPSWLFDFPERFYARHQKYVVQLRTAASGQLPSWEEMQLMRSNLLPAFITANIPLPDHWWRFLSPTQQTFYKKLCPPERNNQRISLPFLYLTLLTDFLERLCNPKIKEAAFSPKEYEILLYADLKQRTFPLGIVDPLDIISNLIDTLDILWSKGKQLSLQNFRSFKFHGLGLLQAKAEAYEKWTTILAYCGGRIEGIGKCGKRPLIYGRDQTCRPPCKRLVCPECGYCQRDCPEYKKRQKYIS
jgi:cold shock CspA family protein